MCENSRCPACLPRLAFDFAIAIAHVEPEYAFRVTGLSLHDWQSNRAAMNGLRRRLRQRLGVYEDVYVVEATGGGRGAHAHVFAWGGDLREWLIWEAMAGGPLRDCFLEDAYVLPARSLPNLSYVVKEFRLDGGGMSLHPRTELALALNHKQIGHATKAFWRDGRSGRPLKTWKATVREAKQDGGLTPGEILRPTARLVVAA